MCEAFTCAAGPWFFPKNLRIVFAALSYWDFLWVSTTATSVDSDFNSESWTEFEDTATMPAEVAGKTHSLGVEDGVCDSVGA